MENRMNRTKAINRTAISMTLACCTAAVGCGGDTDGDTLVACGCAWGLDATQGERIKT